jgi:hypothetical protein
LAANPPVDFPGVLGHPVVIRFKGSRLEDASSQSFASLRILRGPGKIRDTVVFDDTITVEGKISAYY